MKDDIEICFEDSDGDILRVDTEPDEDGQRYVAVISSGDEQGVYLAPDQQIKLAETLLGVDSADLQWRARAAEVAGSILRGRGGALHPAQSAVNATEVIALAEWLAYGETEFAFSLKALPFLGEEDEK